MSCFPFLPQFYTFFMLFALDRTYSTKFNGVMMMAFLSYSQAKKKVKYFTINYDVNCGFFVNIFYPTEEASFPYSL